MGTGTSRVCTRAGRAEAALQPGHPSNYDMCSLTGAEPPGLLKSGRHAAPGRRASPAVTGEAGQGASGSAGRGPRRRASTAMRPVEKKSVLYLCASVPARTRGSRLIF